MSTAKTGRYVLAAGAALLGIGLMIEGYIVTGILCLVGAVLLLPLLYERLLIKSNEVQLLSPTVFFVVALFSFVMLHAVPAPYDIPLKTVYTPVSSQTTTTVPLTTTTAVTSRVETTSRSTVTTTTVMVTTTVESDALTTPLPVFTTAETVADTTTAFVVTTSTSVAPTTETAPPVSSVGDSVGDTVYRTPSGKRYHLNPTCGGKNSYEVTYEDAVEAGLTPCKKCAGG